MALENLLPGDKGFVFRAKINAGFAVTRDHDRALTEHDLRLVAQQATADDALDQAAQAAASQIFRPGDRPVGFSRSLAAGGDPASRPALADGLSVNERGQVALLVGEDLLTWRDGFAIEAGRTYAVRYKVARRQISADPDSDGIRLGLAAYDRFHNRLPAGSETIVVEDVLGLVPAAGVHEKVAVLARAAGAGVDIVIGAATAYLRPFVENFGSAASVTEVEVVALVDITEADLWSPDLTALSGRVGALESLDAGDRLDALEVAVGTPETLHFAAIADAQAATIPGSVDYLSIRGLVFRRAAAGDFQSADGAWWRIAPVMTQQAIGPTLSATSGNHLPTLEVIGATNLYVVPAPTDLVGLYDAGLGLFIGHRIAQLTLPLNASYGIGTNYDVYLFLDGDTVRVGSIAWASGNDRGTGAGTAEIELFQGRFVNRNAVSLRNGSTLYNVPARQALLVGGFNTSGNGMTEDSFTKRLVSNVFTVRDREMARKDPAFEWAYSAAAFVLANNGNGLNRLEYFHVLPGRMVAVEAMSSAYTSTAAAVAVMVGIGIDSLSDAAQKREGATLFAAGVTQTSWASWDGSPGQGKHVLNWLEYGAGVAGTVQTWRGNAGFHTSGITATIPN